MMRRLIITMFFLSLCVLFGCGHESPRTGGDDAAARDDMNTFSGEMSPFEAARFLHMRGVAGDEQAAEQANARLVELLAEQPDDMLVRAYAGSSYLLLARDATLPWDKLDLAKKGLALLDDAVEKAPDRIRVRFVRGVATGNLPGGFGRADQSRADIAWAAERVTDRSEDEDLPAEVEASIHFHYARHLNEQGDVEQARAHWRQAVDLAPDSKAGRAAREALGKHS